MSVPGDGLAAVAQAMRAETLVAVCVHENPDLDAVGAAVGLADLFAQLDVPVRIHLSAGVTLPSSDILVAPGTLTDAPLPPAATVYAVDCGSRRRVAVEWGDWQGRIVNIDHHHDNERYGQLDLVDGDASSASEIVCELAAALGLRPRPAAASALYAGISFDTGHFRHGSTSARTFVCCAMLVEAGADPHRIYQLLYETQSLASLRLWARAVVSAQQAGGGRALVATIGAADYAATGAGEEDTEGIVDALRSVAGVEVAALVRQAGDGRVRVSLRSEEFDVSALAALRGGGGHKLAAGFTAEGDAKEVAEWLSTALDERLSTASS